MVKKAKAERTYLRHKVVVEFNTTTPILAQEARRGLQELFQDRLGLGKNPLFVCPGNPNANVYGSGLTVPEPVKTEVSKR